MPLPRRILFDARLTYYRSSAAFIHGGEGWLTRSLRKASSQAFRCEGNQDWPPCWKRPGPDLIASCVLGWNIAFAIQVLRPKSTRMTLPLFSESNMATHLVS